MTGSVTIRIAWDADAAAIEDVERRADIALFDALRAPQPLEAEEGEVRLGMPGFVLIAEEDDRVVGFVHVIEDDGECHLEQVSVDPAAGRRGIGRALVTAAQEQSRTRGAQRMTLRTFRDIAWNAPFYATCGFVVSEPATAFQRGLVETEHALGLDALGPRVQMTATL